MISTNAAAAIQEDKAALQKILAHYEYNLSHDGGFDLRNLIVQGLRFIFKQIAKFIPENFLPTSIGAINLISYLVIAAGLCLLGFLIYWLSKQWTVQRHLAKGLLLSEQELKLSYHIYLRNAGNEAEAANWKEGARYLFLALLFYCEHKAWIRIEKWKTNGEYMAELQRKQPAMLREFAEGALLFDKVWYGKKAIDAEEYNAMLRRIEPIVREGEFDVSTQ
jgi:hypothetical protein